MSVDDLFKNSSVKTMLAPMAGYTDIAFRKICREFGVGLTVTEMVSAKALVMKNALTKTMLVRDNCDAPCFCQIFGHEPEVMAECVAFPEVRAFEGVDINMGCPVKKIVSNGDGSALMENLSLASKCISSVKNVLKEKFLSVKFRLGVENDKGVADFAKMCADSGADFITVHFRTRKQMYSGKADFSSLPQIVKCGIPVFANGDVKSRDDYVRLIEQGAYGVAVGRFAVGHPQVFAEIAQSEYSADLLDIIFRQTACLKQVYSDKVVANEMKKHICGYLKGKRDTKNTLIKVNTSKTTQEILLFVEEYFLKNPQYRYVKS